MTGKALKGRSALVTGLVQGIGLAVAKSPAGAGANVALHGLAKPDQAATAMAEVRTAGAPDAIFLETDLRDAAASDTMIETLKGWRDIDILVNNAGAQIATSLEDATSEIWETVLRPSEIGSKLPGPRRPTSNLDPLGKTDTAKSSTANAR